MKISHDPSLLTEPEIRSIWNKVKRWEDELSTEKVVMFLEQVFDCDRLTATTVAEILTGSINQIQQDHYSVCGDIEYLQGRLSSAETNLRSAEAQTGIANATLDAVRDRLDKLESQL